MTTLSSLFTTSGVPNTGLTPTITIEDLTISTTVVAAASMIALGNGWYKYNFTAPDDTHAYAVQTDGGSSQAMGERYQIASIDPPPLSPGAGKIMSVTTQYSDGNSEYFRLRELIP